MVETRSKKSAASRDVAAIQQSVPSVRDVVMPKRGKADGSRPTSAASSARSMPTTVSAGHATESFPLATPSPSATPRRTREGGRGTRSTPSTPPSHRRLLPRSQRSPREAPGSGGHGDDADGDAASAERSIDSHVTQFAESLRALRELGLAGIRDFGDEGFREASEEQESEQMRVLLEERSRARDLVRQLERDPALAHGPHPPAHECRLYIEHRRSTRRKGCCFRLLDSREHHLPRPPRPQRPGSPSPIA